MTIPYDQKMIEIGGHSIGYIVQQATIAFLLWQGSKENRREDLTGCYLAIREPARDQVVLVWKLGSFPRLGAFDTLSLYRALDKGKGLNKHPDAWSSYQMPDALTGAVRTEYGSISISGLTGFPDEASSLTLAVMLNWLTDSQARGIASISNNHYLAGMLEAWKAMEAQQNVPIDWEAYAGDVL